MALGLSVRDYADGLRGHWAVPVLPVEEVVIAAQMSVLVLLCF